MHLMCIYVIVLFAQSLNFSICIALLREVHFLPFAPFFCQRRSVHELYGVCDALIVMIANYTIVG